MLTAKPNFASESLPSRHRLDIVVHIANLADNGLPPALAATAVARPDGTTAIVICADGPSSGLSGTQNGVSVHSQVVKQSSVVDLDRSPEYVGAQLRLVGLRLLISRFAGLLFRSRSTSVIYSTFLEAAQSFRQTGWASGFCAARGASFLCA